MDEKEPVRQLEVLLSEIKHANELGEKRLTIMKGRLSVMERLQFFFIPVLVLIGGGTLFAIFKLLQIL